MCLFEKELNLESKSIIITICFIIYMRNMIASYQ
jgi:hypothetical protein